MRARTNPLVLASAAALALALAARGGHGAAEAQRGGRAGGGAERGDVGAQRGDAGAQRGGAGAQRGGAGAQRGAAGGQGGTERPAELAEEFFLLADWDRDGWIRFSEARDSMDLDREGFAGFDTDRDGLISFEEYGARYRAVIARGGVFPVPRRKSSAAGAWRTLDELLEAVDQDRDRALSELEIARALEVTGIQDPPLETVLATLDQDRSGLLEGAELQAFQSLLRPPVARVRPPAASLMELFGQVEEREPGPGTTIQPRRIRGPIGVFRRLDHDRDGAISLADLEELNRPLATLVQPPAVLATFDIDGSGRVDPAEFNAAFRTGAPLER
jgi:hypothetical protein